MKNKKKKQVWNKGLKLSEIPKYKNMGFQKGHKRFTEDLHIFTQEERALSHVKVKENGGPWNTRKKLPQMSGENHHAWKGGHENKLMHNRQRRALKLNAEGSHTLEEWQEHKKKYNYICLCCKKQEPEITLTEDHIVPLINGGSDFIENIQPLCQSCNTRKYTKTINYIPISNNLIR